MTKAGAGKVFSTALILALSTSIGLAQQSANQIYRGEQAQPPVQKQAAEPKQPVEQKPAQEQKKGEEPQVSGVIVPPAPTIIKRKPNTISIPTMIVGSAPTPEETKADLEKPESEIAERPVASSDVRVGSNYGYRRDPFTRRARFHSGVDIKAAWGDPIGASHPGVVEYVGWYYGYGRLVIVNHGGGVTTYYAHLSSYEVAVGDRVGRGTILGYAGSSGRATSPHLHYELRLDGKAVPPFQSIALDPSSGFFTQSPPAAPAPGAATPKDTIRQGAN